MIRDEISHFSSDATGLSAAPPSVALAESPPVGGVAREAERGPRRLRGAAGWGASLALALGLHAAGAAVLFARWQAEPEEVAGAPIILVELAPVTAAPAAVPTEVAPGPPQPQIEEQPRPEKSPEKTETKTGPEPTQDKPLEQAEEKPPEPMEKIVALPPAPDPEPVPPPPPKPAEKKVEKIEKKKPQRHASLASAPSATEQKAERTHAPAPGAPVHSNALPNWKSALVAQLERSKRYPPDAEARREHGVAELAFSVDRAGRVHNARILHSSGSSLLDAATLDLLHRAAPLPPPPPDVAGAQIAIVVPVRYNAR